MKILIHEFRTRRARDGSAVIVVLGLLALMVICVAVNTTAVRSLSRELKLIEKQQKERLQSRSHD